MKSRRFFADLFFVTGSVNMVPGMRISRNMIIVRCGTELTLISSIRLSDLGLAKLESLGDVKHVIRLGDYHLDFRNGVDDPYYADRYSASYWTMPGMNSRNGLAQTNMLEVDGMLPFENASFFSYETSHRPEGLILLHAETGVLISADSLQNFKVDRYSSVLARLVLRAGGFFKPANVGPAWLKTCKPERSDFEKVKELEFSHLLPSHGTPILDTAKEQVCATYARLFDL